MKEIRPHIIGVPQAGISKAKYQAALDDAADKQRDLESTQSQLSSTQSQLQTKTQQYNNLQTEYNTFKGQHNACYQINAAGQIVATRSGMFNGKSAMTKLGLDTSQLTNMDNMFSGCRSLTEIPPINDTSHVTSMSRAFQNCNLITSVPEMDTSSVTNMYMMCDGCNALESIPQLDTSKVEDFRYIFRECHHLQAVPPLDFSKARQFYNMFMYCWSLTSVPDLDLPVAESLVGMFFFEPGHGFTTPLETVGRLNTPNVTNFYGVFSGCTSLRRVESINLVKGTNYLQIFYDCTNLRYCKLLNFGTQPTITGTTGTYRTFRNVANWGLDEEGETANRQSLVDSLLTYSFDRAAAGYDPCTVQLDTDVLNRLTDEEKAAITAKGFTLTA